MFSGSARGVFPDAPSRQDSLQNFARKLRDRNFAVWYIVCFVTFFSFLIRWMLRTELGSYIMVVLHTPVVTIGALGYIGWRRGYLASETAGRCFTIAVALGTVAAAFFTGPHSMRALTRLYSIPSLLLGAVVLKCGLWFVLAEASFFTLAILLFGLGYHPADSIICVECIEKDFVMYPVAITIFICGVFLYDRRDQRLLLERTHQFRDDLLASTSHEFKTPLSGIQGAIELLKDADAIERATLYSTLKHCAAVLKILVRNILTHARNHEGLDVELKIKPVQRVVSKTATILSTLNRKAHISIVIGNEVPANLKVPDQPVSQILLNLGSNAVKYGGSAPEVEISVSFKDNFCEFAVSDEGPGVPEAFRPQLFVPYARGVADGDGTGLGLSICRTLAFELHGSTGYRPREQGGSIFWFRIRVDQPDDDDDDSDSDSEVDEPLSASLEPLETELRRSSSDVDADSTESESATSRPTMLVSVLICEDNPVNTAILKKMVQRLHPERRLDFAVNGAECLEMLLERSRSAVADELIICLIDLNMPLLNGNECCTLFRQYEKLSTKARAVTVKFVSVTAAGIDAVETHLYDAVLLKPVKMKALTSVLNNLK